MPLSELGLNACPIAATKTTSGFSGCTSTAPICPTFFNPICFQVLPSPSDLYTPLPEITFERMPSEPVPTYTIFGSEGATGGGVWKTEDFGIEWNNVSDGYFATPSIGDIQVAPSDPKIVYVGTGSDGIIPKSSVFHTPPPVAPI